MKIDVTSILKDRTEKLHFQGTDNFKFEELDLRGPVELDLTVTNAGREIIVEGQMKAKVHLLCADCLKDFSLPLSFNLSEEFVPESQGMPQAPQDAAMEELSIFTYGADHRIDLREAIRQALLLNLPMHPVCREDCKGLCPTCGRNLNEGECACPRESNPLFKEVWAPLEALKKPNRKSKNNVSGTGP